MYRIKGIFCFLFIFNFNSDVLSQDTSEKSSVTISGVVKNKEDKSAIPYVSVVIKTERDNAFVAGTVTNDGGRFSIANIKPGNYFLEVSFMGFKENRQSLFVGSLSAFLDIPTIELDIQSTVLDAITITTKSNEINNHLDKKTYSIADNISQSGSSVLQSMQVLPGVTVQDGKVHLRGSDKVTILVDGKQTALTGFGSQTGLDNIPASAIDKIEIINNPSSKYDANGNAGIINIIMKKNKQKGFNGKVGFIYGTGSLWVRKENLPTIRPQYTFTPKINPSVSLNYRKEKVNFFL